MLPSSWGTTVWVSVPAGVERNPSSPQYSGIGFPGEALPLQDPVLPLIKSELKVGPGTIYKSGVYSWGGHILSLGLVNFQCRD